MRADTVQISSFSCATGGTTTCLRAEPVLEEMENARERVKEGLLQGEGG